MRLENFNKIQSIVLVRHLFNTHGCEVTDLSLIRDDDVLIAAAHREKFKKPSNKVKLWRNGFDKILGNFCIRVCEKCFLHYVQADFKNPDEEHHRNYQRKPGYTGHCWCVKIKACFSENGVLFEVTLLEAEVFKNREKSLQTYQLDRLHGEYVVALYSMPFRNLPVPFLEVETSVKIHTLYSCCWIIFRCK